MAEGSRWAAGDEAFVFGTHWGGVDFDDGLVFSGDWVWGVDDAALALGGYDCFFHSVSSC